MDIPGWSGRMWSLTLVWHNQLTKRKYHSAAVCEEGNSTVYGHQLAESNFNLTTTKQVCQFWPATKLEIDLALILNKWYHLLQETFVNFKLWKATVSISQNWEAAAFFRQPPAKQHLPQHEFSYITSTGLSNMQDEYLCIWSLILTFNTWVRLQFVKSAPVPDSYAFTPPALLISTHLSRTKAMCATSQQCLT